MKKKSLMFIVELVIVLNMFIILPGVMGYSENHYTREATVICVNNNNNEVIIEDAEGDRWCFYGTGYTRGDDVRVKLTTNCTSTDTQDDEVTDVKVIK